MDTLSQNVKYALALALARHGYKVIPCCWPNPDGRCGCGWHHPERQVGKAPRVAAGVRAASSRTATIWQWWKETPQANVALALAPNLLMLDPDSPEAMLRFRPRWSTWKSYLTRAGIWRR